MTTALRRALMLSCALAPSALAQNGLHPREQPVTAARLVARDTVTVVANGRYDAGSVHRLLMGHTWRDFWDTPIRVPVLDVEHFAGGLKATEVGGAAQTRSLRFVSPDGHHWTFRPLTKDRLAAVKDFDGTVIHDVFRDGLSANFPGAPVISPPFLAAAGVPHPVPLLAVLPDDERLGEFRKEFAGKLGTIEEHLSDAKPGEPAFANAHEVIDAKELKKRLNTIPARHIDARKQYAARLVDLLIGDHDRHQDQWKWARMTAEDELLTPIPRDRDQALGHHDGLLLNAARILKPYLVTFDSTYPTLASERGLSRDLDVRLLAEIDRRTADSIGLAVKRAITDSVIRSAVRLLPAAYQPMLGSVEARLRARRDHLDEESTRFYLGLAGVAVIHATDADDRARIERGTDGSVTIELGEDARPWFKRRFVPSETQEVRLFLHGGDDRATVTGGGNGAIAVRVVGGGGDNTLVDSSTAGGTMFYDRGPSEPERFRDDSAFNRLPLVRQVGTWVLPAGDRGSATGIYGSYSSGKSLGLVPGIGVRHDSYGFRYAPYRSRVALLAEMSSTTLGFRVTGIVDRRFEQSRLHAGADAQFSQLELVQYSTPGNDVTNDRDVFHEVDQRQWAFRPTIGLSYGPRSDVSLGPVVKYVVTDSVPGRALAEENPYGLGSLGQVGVEAKLVHDTRDDPGFPRGGVLVRATGAAYAGAWSLRGPFQRLGGSAAVYVPLPARKSVLALRAGGEKVYGQAPFYEAAFLGGSRNLRALPYHRFAGDASLFGTAELRVPLLKGAWILPWDIGALGYAESGRVYLSGDSPGGWHRAVGGGFWFGVLSPRTSVSVLLTNSKERTLLLGTGMSF